HPRFPNWSAKTPSVVLTVARVPTRPLGSRATRLAHVDIARSGSRRCRGIRTVRPTIRVRPGPERSRRASSGATRVQAPPTTPQNLGSGRVTDGRYAGWGPGRTGRWG